MDDDYELVPKDLLSELKEENKKLKEELSKHEKHYESTKLLTPIVRAIQDEGKKERELILNHLREIKDLNKSTLTNIINKNDSLDNRLESLMGALDSLVDSLKEITAEIGDMGTEHSKQATQELAESLERVISDSGIYNVEEKLKEIEDFMTNLKVLLSQVKPDNMRI